MITILSPPARPPPPDATACTSRGRISCYYFPRPVNAAENAIPSPPTTPAVPPPPRRSRRRPAHATDFCCARAPAAAPLAQCRRSRCRDGATLSPRGPASATGARWTPRAKPATAVINKRRAVPAALGCLARCSIFSAPAGSPPGSPAHIPPPAARRSRPSDALVCGPRLPTPAKNIPPVPRVRLLGA